MKRKLLVWEVVMRQIAICCLLFLPSLNLFAQNSANIQGQVVDAVTKEPLIGVSILEKETTNGTITDFDGKFSLAVKDMNATVAFIYIGYLSAELKAGAAGGIIQLKEDAKALDEVVVVGYGVQKKVNLSGAVSAIEGSRIAAKPATDVLTALQGELPGVAILRSSGQPGSETSGIRIRGFSSVNSTQALVLIDGIEGDMTLLNPSDIESISVLKDAASSAIYGARAAAGVVLITTKNGKTGKPQVSYNGYYGINLPGNMPERLPAWEEQEFINIARFNQRGAVEWNAEQSSWVGNPNFNNRLHATDANRWEFFQSTNWVNEGTKDNTSQQSHAVSVSGGSKELNYLVSTNYYSKNGLLKYGPDGNERYNFRVKVNSEINPYINLAFNTSYEGSFKETPSYGATNVLELLYRSRGRQPIYNPEWDTNENMYNGDLQRNGIAIMKEGGANKNQYEAFTGKATLTVKDVVKGLSVNLSASRKAGYYSEQVNNRTLIFVGRAGGSRGMDTNVPNSLKKKKNNDFHDLFEATVNYDISLGKHTIGLLGGSTYENYRKDEIEGTVKSLVTNDFFSFNYYDNSNITNTSVNDLIEPWSMMSYFGRLNYNFADRYLFEANIRYDGSSRLTPANRWKAFPSFSVAWRVNEESWFSVPQINNLKLRTSWGQLGNGAVLGLYDYLALISSGTLMGNPYYYQDVLASKNKTWETVESTNIGFDLGILNNRLNFTADYYWKYNNDMLASVNLPAQIGIKTPNANIGILKTWGWEFEIGWKDKMKDLSYQVSFNLSDSQNELVKYSGVNIINAGTVDRLEGYSLNTIWGYKTDGYWSSREEYLAYKEAHPGFQSFNDGMVNGGDTKYLTQGNPDHTIGAGGGTPEEPGDLVCFGDANGRYLYGLNIGLQWKGVDFSMMWQGIGKRTVVIDGGTITPLAVSSQMPWTIHRDYWTEDNQDARWPRLYEGDTFNNHPSDRTVQDAAYLRLKNITVGYTIPLRKNIVERLRVYVAGADIWEHTNMLSVFDPEAGNNTKATYYPFFRTWTMGLNLTF
ncbi:TonB-dependent receptor SusC [termite gut metagenome]|uniref:TonB-dependent receptor SusC n=1 Tax=termite gut metagenome TaxID=433724 RepID=A0A5J4SB86_9ZZZZ